MDTTGREIIGGVVHNSSQADAWPDWNIHREWIARRRWSCDLISVEYPSGANLMLRQDAGWRGFHKCRFPQVNWDEGFAGNEVGSLVRKAAES